MLHLPYHYMCGASRYTHSLGKILLEILHRLYTRQELRVELEHLSSRPVVRFAEFRRVRHWARLQGGGVGSTHRRAHFPCFLRQVLSELFASHAEWRFDSLGEVCMHKRVPMPWTDATRQEFDDLIQGLVHLEPLSVGGAPTEVVALDDALHNVVAFWSHLSEIVRTKLDKALESQMELRQNEAARIITSWESKRRLQIKVASKKNRMGPQEKAALKEAVAKHGQDFRLIVRKYKWARARFVPRLAGVPCCCLC